MGDNVAFFAPVEQVGADESVDVCIEDFLDVDPFDLRAVILLVLHLDEQRVDQD